MSDTEREPLEARIAALEGRLQQLDQLQERVTAHALESIWAHLEQQGLAGFPARIAEEVKAAGAGSTDLAARLSRLEAALDPSALAERVCARVLESIDYGALSERLVVSASRPLMQQIDRRLEELGKAEERFIRTEQKLERLEANVENEDASRERQLRIIVQDLTALKELVQREVLPAIIKLAAQAQEQEATS